MQGRNRRTEVFWQIDRLSAGFLTGWMPALAVGIIVALSFAGRGAYGQDTEPLTSPKCPTCPIVIPARPMSTKDWNDMREKNARKLNFDAANAERKRLLDDEASKLLILAKDLKAKTDKLGTEPLPPMVEKEAAMIEFLAKDLKQKMKLTVGTD